MSPLPPSRARFHLEIANTLAWYESSPAARRGFCYRCGSSLLWDCYEKPTMGILAGTPEPPTGLVTEQHIHVEDANDCYDVAT